MLCMLFVLSLLRTMHWTYWYPRSHHDHVCYNFFMPISRTTFNAFFSRNPRQTGQIPLLKDILRTVHSQFENNVLNILRKELSLNLRPDLPFYN